ncbi:MAG: signal transduction histidine kinase regulating citrate/malate metabolism [Herbinix sp.]|nr:signal transduction histidine kinase regulating citrate/malate metabolism [Herbinix sp.]
MNFKKLVGALLLINLLQFFIGLIILLIQGRTIIDEVSIYMFLAIGLLLLSSLITIMGLYFAIRYKNDNMTETIQNLEELNTRLRSQRHDYLNHFQVIYGLMELGEYEEAKSYIDPVFKDIMKVSKALKTAQPAVNALLQAKTWAAEKKGIDLYLEIRSELKNLPLEAWNLCKVLANIIDNGITALEEEQDEKSIHLEIGEDQNNYTFLIYNNGPEIPSNHLDAIFKQGYSTKREEEHGMGLYIVSRIIKEAGGTIQVDSNADKTSFYIELPKANKR